MTEITKSFLRRFEHLREDQFLFQLESLPDQLADLIIQASDTVARRNLPILVSKMEENARMAKLDDDWIRQASETMTTQYPLAVAEDLTRIASRLIDGDGNHSPNDVLRLLDEAIAESEARHGTPPDIVDYDDPKSQMVLRLSLPADISDELSNQLLSGEFMARSRAMGILTHCECDRVWYLRRRLSCAVSVKNSCHDVIAIINRLSYRLESFPKDEMLESVRQIRLQAKETFVSVSKKLRLVAPQDNIEKELELFDLEPDPEEIGSSFIWQDDMCFWSIRINESGFMTNDSIEGGKNVTRDLHNAVSQIWNHAFLLNGIADMLADLNARRADSITFPDLMPSLEDATRLAVDTLGEIARQKIPVSDCEWELDVLLVREAQQTIKDLGRCELMERMAGDTDREESERLATKVASIVREIVMWGIEGACSERERALEERERRIGSDGPVVLMLRGEEITIPEEMKDANITELGIDSECAQALIGHRIATLGDLSGLSERDILISYGAGGRRLVRQMKDGFARLGLVSSH